MSESIPQKSQPAAELRPHLVLVVDDEPAILRLVTHLLRKSGYEVASAHTAR
jgi:CheY-like chemotaxis protein